MARASAGARARSSVDEAEAARFARMAADWWDPDGAFRPLHRITPARIAFVRDQLAAHFGREPLAGAPLAGLSLLDVGCGGGLVAEPMTRLGARVVGIDVAPEIVAAAAAHAEDVGLEIDYRAATAEELAAAGEAFDVVLAMEVVEHVADLGAFLDACAALVRPGGAMVVATLTRTAKAFALAVVGAEYVLGWLPRGTHDWRRFVRPSELARGLRGRGLAVEVLAGLAYDPLTGGWALSRDLAVNYMAFATRA